MFATPLGPLIRTYESSAWSGGSRTSSWQLSEAVDGAGLARRPGGAATWRGLASIDIVAMTVEVVVLVASLCYAIQVVVVRFYAVTLLSLSAVLD